MKQVCVIGLGQFGTHLARSLARMECEVLAIDSDDAAVATVRDDVQHALITDVRSLDALQSAVSKNIDEAVVCLGENMEASILATLHLKKIGVGRIRAKASTQDHASILKAVGADEVIFPEQETATRMAHRIVNPDLLDYLPLSPDYRVVEVPVREDFVGKSLAELHFRKHHHVLVIAIKGADGRQIDFLPAADAVLQHDNTLVVIGRDEDITGLAPKEKSREDDKDKPRKPASDHR